MVKYDIDSMKKFFDDPINKTLLEQNDFDQLFENFYYFKGKNNFFNQLAQFLIDANIEFISYLTELTPEMFASVTFKSKSVVLPNGINSIPRYCFTWSNIESIDLPDSVELIDKFAFELCNKLREIKLPDNLKNIEKGAFNRCESLAKIKINNNIEKIATSAFNGCTNLHHIEFDGKIYKTFDDFYKDF